MEHSGKKPVGMASYHLGLGFYLNFKAAQLFQSGCTDPVIGGNLELFIHFGHSKYDPYIFHLPSKVIYLKWVSPFTFYQKEKT